MLNQFQFQNTTGEVGIASCGKAEYSKAPASESETGFILVENPEAILPALHIKVKIRAGFQP